MHADIPLIVLELVKHAATERIPNPVPIAWKEYPGSWVIVFQDGRKIHFIKEDVQFKNIFHTKQETIDVVKTLTPRSTKKGDQ